jgi:hypothetical protein
MVGLIKQAHRKERVFEGRLWETQILDVGSKVKHISKLNAAEVFMNFSSSA